MALADDERSAFARTVHDQLGQMCAPEAVRAAPAGAAERWRAVAEVGLLGAAIPEVHGGLGLDEVALVLALEETGFACLPEPVVESFVAAGALTGSDLAGEWLPQLAAGDAVLTVSVTEVVAHAEDAGLLVLRDGDALYAVARAGAELEARPSLDPTRPLSGVRWARADAIRIGGESEIALAADRGAFATAAQLVGIGRRAVEMGADHARERRQFGRPIGSFQAVKHLLANAHLAVEFARPVVHRAALSIARDEPTRARDASMAKAMASEAAVAACRAALQVHGAIGYTEEHDLHLWLRRGFALTSAWGDAPRHRERVRAALLG